MKYIQKIYVAIVSCSLCMACALDISLVQDVSARSGDALHTEVARNAWVRRMIGAVFGPAYSYAAVAVASCESGLNPLAYNPFSGAAGVYQFMLRTWWSTSQRYYSRFNAYANILAAHEVFVRDGYSWRAWQCRP